MTEGKQAQIVTPCFPALPGLEFRHDFRLLLGDGQITIIKDQLLQTLLAKGHAPGLADLVNQAVCTDEYGAARLQLDVLVVPVVIPGRVHIADPHAFAVELESFPSVRL